MSLLIRKFIMRLLPLWVLILIAVGCSSEPSETNEETSDLNEEAFLTNNVAGLACNPVALLTVTSLDTILFTSIIL